MKRRYRTKKYWRAREHALWLAWWAMSRGLPLQSDVLNMAEIRISDKMLNDPRMLRLANRPKARLLFWEAHMWADREGSEGIIDDVVIPGLCRGFEREMQIAIDALVEVGLWVRRNTGYYIVGYMESGKATRAERLAREQEIREARSEAGRAGAAERERRRAEASAQANGEQTPSKSSSVQANGEQPIYAPPPDEAMAPLPDEERF